MKKAKKDNRARERVNKKTISFKEEDDVEVFYEPAGFGIPLKVENDEENVENENSAAANVRRQSELYTSWKERNGNPTERNSPGRYSMFVAGIQQFDPYQELTSTQIAAFRQVFDMVDKDGGGSIDADELYGAMKDLEPSLKLREIREIIEELDRAGNGTIDFDEFLYMMTSMSMQVDTHPSAGDRIRSDDVVGRKRQSVFFSVITKFAMRHSLKEIERYYASKSRHTPHVVAHYAAGACVEGLSEKELRQEWRHLLMASKGKDSPYAQPLNFYTMSSKRKQKQNQIKKRSSNKNMISPELQRLGDLSPSPTSRSPTSRYSQYSRDSDSPESVELDRELAGSRCSSRSKSPGSPRPESRGWTPRHGLPITKVPLPMVIYNQSKNNVRNKLTIIDMDKIRDRITVARNCYYNQLNLENEEKAAKYWETLKINEIPSKRLRRNFLKVFRAYSPTNEYENHIVNEKNDKCQMYEQERNSKSPVLLRL